MLTLTDPQKTALRKLALALMPFMSKVAKSNTLHRVAIAMRDNEGSIEIALYNALAPDDLVELSALQARPLEEYMEQPELFLAGAELEQFQSIVASAPTR